MSDDALLRARYGAGEAPTAIIIIFSTTLIMATKTNIHIKKDGHILLNITTQLFYEYQYQSIVFIRIPIVSCAFVYVLVFEIPSEFAYLWWHCSIAFTGFLL